MQFKELQLNHFGKFHNKTLTLKEGINLIYGENEAGKSTIHYFIRGMLFGIEKQRGRASKEDAYTKYQPWDTIGAYSGSLILESFGKCYRINRNFDKNNKNLIITDMDTGREINLSNEELAEFYGGLTEGGYRNTISIEQLKAKTDQELAEEVRNYVTNLSMSKSSEVDVAKALSHLQERKKQLEEEQIEKRLKALEQEIEEGLKKEERADRLSTLLDELKEKEKLLFKKKEQVDNVLLPEGFNHIREYQEYLEEFPAIWEKAINVSDLKEQLKALCEKQTLIQKEIKEEGESSDPIRKGIEELVFTMNLLNEAKEKEREFTSNRDKSFRDKEKKNKLYCFIPILTSLIWILLFLGKNPALASGGAVILAAALGVYIYLGKKVKKEKEAYNQRKEAGKKEQEELILRADRILQHFKVAGEEELRGRYEGAIRRESMIESLKERDREYASQIKELESKISNIEQEVMGYYCRLSESFDNEDEKNFSQINGVHMERLRSFVKTQRQMLREKKEAAAKEYEACLLQKEKLRWELNSLEGYEEKLMQDQDLYEELQDKQRENEIKLEALKLAIDTINSLSVHIHDSFGRELNHMVSSLIKDMTKESYTEVKIDEKLNIKVGHKDLYVQLDKLSTGTMEQLYFALRIAVADLLYKDFSMPVLLDDCFAYYDEKRTVAALEYLYRRGGQVLLFTCHKREKEILDSLRGSYHYIDLSQ